MTKRYGWKFLRIGGALEDGITVYAGMIMQATNEGEIAVDQHGIRYSVKALDAMSDAPGDWVVRVEDVGTEYEEYDGREIATNALLALCTPFDARPILNAFLRWCIEQVRAAVEELNADRLTASEIEHNWLNSNSPVVAWDAWDTATDIAVGAAWIAGDAGWNAARNSQYEQLEQMLLTATAIEEGGK